MKKNYEITLRLTKSRQGSYLIKVNKFSGPGHVIHKKMAEMNIDF
jgi:heme/copper-type cytochrome/quinol oxidase subunit 2